MDMASADAARVIWSIAAVTLMLYAGCKHPEGSAQMNRWVTITGLIITTTSFAATMFPPTHKAAVILGLIGAIATAVGRALWPDSFPPPPPQAKK